MLGYLRHWHASLGRGQVERAGKHAAAAKQLLFVGVEQGIAALDGAPQRLLVRRQVVRPIAEQIEPVVRQARQHRLRRQEVDARRHQLDGQWQAVQAQADLGNDRQIGGCDKEVWVHGLGALGEEFRRGGGSQRVHLEPLLGAHAQRFARGDEQVEARAGCQQVHQQSRGVGASGGAWLRGQEVLEVVQHQQQFLMAQVVGQPLLRRALAPIMRFQRGGDGGCELRRRRDAGEGDDAGAAGKKGLQLRGNGQGQPRLADAGRAQQGEQAPGGVGRGGQRRRRSRGVGPTAVQAMPAAGFQLPPIRG